MKLSEEHCVNQFDRNSKRFINLGSIRKNTILVVKKPSAIKRELMRRSLGKFAKCNYLMSEFVMQAKYSTVTEDITTFYETNRKAILSRSLGKC